MFNSAGHICTITLSLLCTSLCRGCHFFQALGVLVTSHTDCLVLPKPSFSISMSSVEKTRKSQLFLLGSCRMSFPDFWRRLFHWKTRTFSFPAVITNTRGSGSLFNHLQSLLSTLSLQGFPLRTARDDFHPLAWGCSLGRAAEVQEGSWALSPGQCWIRSTELPVLPLLQPQVVSGPLFHSSLYPTCAKMGDPQPALLLQLLVVPGWSKILTPYGKSWCGYPYCTSLPPNE